MINYNHTSKLLISGIQDNSILNLKPKASQGTSDSEFKSVFDKALNNKTKSTYATNSQKNGNDISHNNDSKVKYNSFRDAERTQRVCSEKISREKPVEDVKSQGIDLELPDNSSERYDEQISVLAQMLGLQPNELVKLADEVGFSSEDLKDVNKLSLFVDKLAKLLDLNALQKTMMNTLVEEVSKQVKTESGLEAVSNTESPITNEANTSVNTKTTDLSKIADEVKAKLNQLIQNATVNSEAVSSEISKVIEAMKAQVKAKVTTNSEQVETKSITADILNDGKVTNEKESAKTGNSKEDTNSENADSSDNKAEVANKSVNTQVSSTSTDQNQQNVQIFGDVKIGMINNQIEAQKAESSMPQPVKTSEVLNQVLEQAKVIIGQDKSEMIIQLKPDHLGKIELKVVTEQGIVAAKFIAESQQVKEIIETNMQLLKDALEKQGISVDSVNVQVGHDKQNEYQQQNSFQSKNNSSNNRAEYGISEVGIATNGFNAFDALPERLAQYAYESNTINLTA